MGSFASRILTGALCLLVAVGLRADSTDDVWRYVPLTKLADNPLYTSLIAKGSGNPTGVITNGDWQLFVIQGTTPNELELNIRPRGWAPNNMCAWIAGSGVLDLSKPILSEDGQTQYAITTMSPNALRYGCVVTHFIAPTTLNTLDDYVFHQNSTNIVSATFDCPHVTVVGRGIFYNEPQLNNMKSLILNFPNATNVLDHAFRKHASMTTFEVSFPKVTAYGAYAFLDVNLSLVEPEDFNLGQVRTIGTNAFYVSRQSDIDDHVFKTDTLRLDAIERLEYGALCYLEAKTVILGRDNLRWVGARALSGRIIPQIVFGTSPAGTELEGAISPVWTTGGGFRYWFRGPRPTTLKSPEDAVLLRMSENCQGMVFIPHGEDSWASLVASAREPTVDERGKLEANYPDVAADRVLGVIEPSAMGGTFVSHNMFLAYGDYRAQEHLLYVRGEPAEYAAVKPAYGVTDAYMPGEVVSLVAPVAPVPIGGSQVKAVKYVVEELDVLGRWTRCVTNSYVDAGTQITMPVSGTSIRVTWIFESAHEFALSHDTDYQNESVTISGASLEDGKTTLVHGSVVTLTAQEESDTVPKAHFAFWQGDIGDADPSNRVLTLVMDRPRQVTAVFDHDWYIETIPNVGSYGTMTDGKWIINFYRKNDSGHDRVMKLGKNWSYGAVVSGAGRINLDTDIIDAEGFAWIADSMEANAFRFTGTGDQQNVVTDCTFPKTLASLGMYVFYGCTSVTNVVVDCPVLTASYYGHFYGCTNLQKLKFKCDILEDFNLLENDKEGSYGLLGRSDYITPSASACLEELEFSLPALKRIPPNLCCAGPLTRTDATGWRFDSVTNVCTRAFFAKTYAPGPYGTLSLPALETISGYRIAWSRGFDAVILGSGKLRDLGRTVSDGGALFDVKEEFRGCTRLGRIEIGLAPNAYLEAGLFSGEGLTGITNVTFTGAAPSGPELFEGLAVRAAVGHSMRLYASSSQSGWTDVDFPATCTATGIVPLGQMSAADRAAVRELPREERRQFMGMVYNGKPFGWLFDTDPWSAGLRVIVK